MPDYIPVKTSYTGSKFFEPVAASVGLPIDRLNFLIAQAFAIFLAYAYRKVSSQGKYSYNQRLIGALLPGIFLGIFCYGRDLFHLVLLGFLGYWATLMTDARSVHKVVLLVAFLYLSYVHLIRMLYDCGGYILDITGPVMIGTQKVTSIAFSVHDGQARREEELTQEQRKYAIRRKPSLLEYFSYVFSFQTLMCGPLVYYNDYIEFITEENFTRHSGSSDKQRPSPTWVVVAKLANGFFYAFMVVVGQSLVSPERLVDDDFLRDSSMAYIIVYMIMCTSAARFKYYLAWKLGETICNASGLGFCGFSPEDGSADWGLANNIEAWKFETSLNFKGVIDNWNKTTQSWLRRCVYERVHEYRTVMTYVMSAVWHGFWPGYYLTFLTGALVTTAARRGRRVVRPLFQSNRPLAAFYDLITFLLTRIYLAYATAPFVLLTLDSSLKLYSRLYFFGHVQCILAILLFPLMASGFNSNRVKGQTGQLSSDDGSRSENIKKTTKVN